MSKANEKVIFEVYLTYGKDSGEELDERFLIKNTAEDKLNVLENYGFELSSQDDLNKFVTGVTDTLDFFNYGGDWDEPTGGHFQVTTKDKLINDIKKRARKEITKVENMFSDK